MRVVIEIEPANSVDAVKLITELEAVLDPLYPSESRHGYSIEKLLQEGVLFCVLRVNGVAAACGGIQFYGDDRDEPAYGELKRMYVRPAYRGRGFAKHILEFLSQCALERKISLLRLETGHLQHEAIGLYESMGFRRIPPFGMYRDDPLSYFYEKQLQL